MVISAGGLAATTVLLAALLDRLVGDPMGWPHPVVVMGWWINRLRPRAEDWAGDSRGKLRIAGLLITLFIVGGSGLSGWLLEQLAWGEWRMALPWGALLAQLLVTVALASALAGRSLDDAVNAVLDTLQVGDPPLARERLQWIVGRDTAQLSEADMLRATAETAAENGVDGLFAPLFWMLAGLLLTTMEPGWPGPLALAWAFKASSTLDSMLGYRHGRLRWLGTAGARLDDLLVWLPCRLVMVTLPLICRAPGEWKELVIAANRDGQADPSPNAGRAEAIYAHCAGLRLGGRNRYGDRWVDKPILAANQPPPNAAGVRRILQLNRQLEGLWLLAPVALLLTQMTQ